MKKIIVLILITLFIAPNSFSAVDGNQPYTPTAIEWLLINCLALAPKEKEFAFDCVIKDSNTISLSIIYEKEKAIQKKSSALSFGSESLQNKAEFRAHSIKSALEFLAKNKEWSWLKVTKVVVERP